MKNGNLTMPMAIVIAGLIIGGAILFTNRDSSIDKEIVGDKEVSENNTNNNLKNPSPDLKKLTPVDENDHIQGSLNAKVTIVEFSDFECPFCGRVHPTLKQIVEEYNGQVAWVYRHFPLSQIHSNAEPLAQASECVAELGGNDTFWDFADGIFENKINLADLSGVTEITGIDKTVIQNCVDSGKYATEVAKDTENAIATGGRGTPHSVIVGPNGVSVVVSGAQPITAWKQIIDQMLAL